MESLHVQRCKSHSRIGVMEMVKLIVFALNDVLVDTKDMHYEELN